jgi:hypothetical protein
MVAMFERNGLDERSIEAGSLSFAIGPAFALVPSPRPRSLQTYGNL